MDDETFSGKAGGKEGGKEGGEDGFDEPASRSARKRDAQAARALGDALTALTPEQQAALPLPDRLRDALKEFRRLRARGARKRQLQFIGGIMRDIDTDAIQAAIDERDGQSAAARYELHALEGWRDRLLNERDALTAYIDAHPQVDRQPLRQAVDRAARSQRALAASEPGAGRHEQLARAARTDARALFRLLREHADAADPGAEEHG